MATIDQIIQNTTASLDNMSGTLNSIANYVVRGSDDRQHGAMGLIMGPVYSLVWKDLTAFVDSLLGLNIGDYCDFNKRMYGYMTRLMLINLWEKQTTLSTLGESAMNNGDANSVSTPAQKPPYVTGNYYGDFVNELHRENKVGVESTRRRLKDPQNNVYPDYDNLYPDDLDSGLFDNKWTTNNPNSILYKTKALFKAHKLNTIISRFSTRADGEEDVIYNGKIDTESYGESHGRNLLTKSAENGKPYSINGYNNPYCRVWTHHHQYNKLGRLIRPFSNEDEDGNFITKSPSEVHDWTKSGWKSGDDYFYQSSDNEGWDKSVLDKTNGILNIVPKYTNGGCTNIHTRDCMFSIENLAWKDYNPYSFEQALSWEQRGPMGGRIMWFPPYGLTFNETTQVNWGANTFIGRGEDVYTYTNTKRTGTLRFIMITDHPSIVDYATWYGQDPDNPLKDTDIHRFFAGCDPVDAGDKNSLLSHVKPTPLTDEYIEKNGDEEPSPELTPVEVDEGEPDKIEKVTFAVFFPNNYAGFYDNDVVFTIKYLLSGSDAEKNEDGTDKDFEIGSGPGYEMSSNGISTANAVGGVIYGNKTKWTTDCKKKYDKDDSKEWHYRIDGQYKYACKTDEGADSMYVNTYDQFFTTKSNYSDTIGFSMNSSLDKSSEMFKNDDSSNVYTFTEVFAALLASFPDSDYANEKEKYENFLSDKINNERVEKLKDIFTNYDLNSCICKGWSNAHGSKKKNEVLATHRGETIKEWLKKFFKKSSSKIKHGKDTPDYGDKEKFSSKGVSDHDAKLWRSVKVEMNFKAEGREPVVSEYDDYVGYHRTGEIIGDGEDAKVVYMEGKRGSKNGKKWIKVKDKFIAYDNTQSSLQARAKNGDYSFQLENVENNNVQDKEGSSDVNIYRFDQEYHFFKKLELDNPPVFKTLMEKLQYFDPAFHSITPEGFNARLTFLNQCTRQGNTISTSDRTGNAASNLAFGRPPFCVLRLGDFYNQMIVIENINLNFDVSGGICWDMNEEGIGVQPMLCEVSINFVFIGGSDMTGPVRRLQNAATFNYYANTRLYDNRADRMSYGDTNWLTMGGNGNNEIDKENSYFYFQGDKKKSEAEIRAERINKAENQ